ncbi:MAG: regulatory protein RecX [Gammaproteobacteria bacterium]|jgi:regulatory protein|nr:regulatory protein RecX [Gammaproteobacteria bacterium]NCF80714.1 regulatory protein RecX [Pseudomonadota bacterium]
MDLLARREHSRIELRRKLAARGFPQPLVDAQLDVLETENLLSDQRFTEGFVAYRAARGQGPLKIRYELRERGVSDHLVTQFMDSDRQIWCDRALAVRRKRFGTEGPEDIRERSRQARFLAQRGFEQDHIRFALDCRETD